MPELNPLELAHEEKRVRSLFKTAEGRQALRNVTGYDFVYEDDVDRAKLPIVQVLVPTYRGVTRETTAAFEKMLAFSRGKCILVPQPSTSTSIVHWSRNGMLAALYKQQAAFDYVLYMDDDMVPPPDAVVKLLAHKRDVVAGAATVRMDPPHPNFRTYDPVEMTYRTAFQWTGEGLLNIGGVGTGFMLLSPRALEAAAEYYLSCYHEKTFFGMPEEIAKRVEAGRRETAAKNFDCWWFENLKHPMGHGEYSEDLSFCFKARAMGLETFVDTTVKVGHVGTYVFSLDDYFHYQKEVVEEQVPVGQRVTDDVASLLEEVSS